MKLLTIALTPHPVLAAPTPAVGSSENPAHALQKRIYNLTCNGGQLHVCRDTYGTVCINETTPRSRNALCKQICWCDWFYECGGFGGCYTVPVEDDPEPLAVKGGDDKTATDTVEIV
ncbi:hypothetical protein B0T18DRAFT_430099 [Schizothecium vesticola]|uniref:Uncharacterized protein n=1 Tax=Schizothecium vesticola TaxID=314040 RepID=A0AA40K1S3_9PEZI|nr:hypothetical protein B0T18DRAFT_430099 [Schizothecium vesticola]